MDRQDVRIVVLCEDEDHRRFSYHVLGKLRYHPRDIRFAISPRGRGAADLWIKKTYPEEVRGYRRRAANQQVALLVLVDADRLSVKARHKHLDDALAEAGQGKRSKTDHIALWVPKRHIETWIVFLVKHTKVDEKKDYKNEARNLGYDQAASRFVELYQGPPATQDSAPPSMRTTFGETAQLDW